MAMALLMMTKLAIGTTFGAKEGEAHHLLPSGMLDGNGTLVSFFGARPQCAGNAQFFGQEQIQEAEYNLRQWLLTLDGRLEKYANEEFHNKARHSPGAGQENGGYIRGQIDKKTRQLSRRDAQSRPEVS